MFQATTVWLKNGGGRTKRLSQEALSEWGKQSQKDGCQEVKFSGKHRLCTRSQKAFQWVVPLLLSCAPT